MELNEFRKNAHDLVDWIADYYQNIESYPVRSQSEPGDTLKQLPVSAPAEPESFDKVFDDFEKIIMPGMTHWQHPKFFAYFPANSSFPSLLAEMLTSALAAQCMSWQTSPAATELEERVMEWLRDSLGLPSGFSGVIQDTASTATLCAILTARERASHFGTNTQGLVNNKIKYAIYCSGEAHSSVDKAVRIAGIGSDNLRKIPTTNEYGMCPKELEQAIKNDIENDIVPLCVIATIGTTSSTAIDPLDAIVAITKKYKIFTHIDAAFAGSAFLLPEFRTYLKGIEDADSFVFNPHKWMLTNFDCSAYFVKNKTDLIKTFTILPEYLKTKEGDKVNNYRDWGVPLGRRFRALKLWFVMRSYGLNGIQSVLRNHIEIAHKLAQEISRHKHFELITQPIFNLVCFRWNPGKHSDSELDDFNHHLLEALNNTGAMYLTHTKLKGVYTLRLVVGQTHVTKSDVESAWQTIQSTADRLAAEKSCS